MLGIKIIDGYPDYEIYDDGRVYSHKTKRFLKPSLSSRGYCTVELANSAGSKRVLVHRLVAQAFIPNPDCLPQVNHINEVKTDNRVSNLEWVTPLQNMRHGTREARRMAHTDYTTQRRKDAVMRNSRKVWRRVKNLDTGEVFESERQAARHYGISNSHIGECCRGQTYKTVGGYRWAFA